MNFKGFLTLCFVVSLYQSGIAQNTMVDWNFPNNPDDATVDYSTSANSAVAISTQGGTGAISYSTGGATTNSASATTWTSGSGSKWWEISFSTLYYSGLEISSKQRSSATGPRDFKAQYKIGAGGTWTDITGATAITVANDYDSGVLTDVALPAACENQSSVYIRWIMTSNTSVGAGTTANAGVSNIDDIRIQGTAVVDWNFPSSPDNATVDQGVAANTSQSISLTGATNLAFSNTGASTRCAFADGWDSGSGTKFWQVSFSTMAYYNMELFSRQASSNTGPRDFKVQYKVGAAGTWTDLSGASVTIAGATVFDAGVIQHIMLPSVCENQPSVYLRWIMTSNTSVGGGATAAAGTSRIDDIKVSGSLNNYHYRSVVTTGTWVTLTSWETSLDLVNWKPAPALAPPTYRSLTVNVRNAHTITYDVTDTADQITVSSGGKLVYTAAININNGTGVDLQIDGTMVDSCAANANFMSSATWAFGAAGNLYKHLTGAFDVWRDNYNGGMSAITSTATIILWKTGNADPAITTTGGTYFPNLILKNTHTSAWAVSFAGSSNYPRILGDFDIGGTGTQAVNFTNTCTHATPIPVAGNTTIRSGSTLTLASGAVSGTGFDLNGNLVNNGTLSYGSNGGSRVMKFSGSNSQTISGSGTSTFYSLEINKTTNDLTLSQNITINNLLNLSQGNFITSATSLPAMSAGSFVSGASNSSFVKGPISKTGSTDFTFPVGKNSKYRPIAVSSITGTETFTAEYFYANPHTGAAPCPCSIYLHDPSLNHISTAEYWILNRAGNDSAFVTLSWDTYSQGITSTLTLRVARWDGASWRDHGNGGTTGLAASTGTVTTTNRVASFSPFTLASSTFADNPLPIKLTEFTADYNGKNVDLNWSTQAEINNDHFTIEKSKDLNSFEIVSTVAGAGNSDEILLYHSVDKNPWEGISYYRLSQTDFDGKISRSNPVAVSVTSDEHFGLITIYSDHSEGAVKCTVHGSGDLTFYFRITDVLGRTVLMNLYRTEIPGAFSLDATNLKPGVYFLTVSDGNHVVTKKFVY